MCYTFAVDAVLHALSDPSRRTVVEALRRGPSTAGELAALLLNVAAGELFPANTKCRLFLGTPLDQDGDGTADGTVASAIGAIISEIQAGDLFSLLDALSMASQINSGQDVIGMALFH